MLNNANVPYEIRTNRWTEICDLLAIGNYKLILKIGP